MAKHIRFGMLATLALHAVPLGIWWMLPAHLPGLSQATPNDKVLQVRFRPAGDGGSVLPQELPPVQDAVPDQFTATAPAGPVPVALSADRGEAPPFPSREPPYIPAGELDTRPSPEAPVVVPFPGTLPGISRAGAVLVLYIGADGRMDRVEVDESNLPPDFEKTAIETFLQARMWPGILNGQATRARMKILVEFEQH